MFGTLHNLTSEQWLTAVILPLGVGITLIGLGVVLPKLPLVAKAAALWIITLIGDAWLCLSLRLRSLFLSKEQKQHEAEARQKVMQYIERQQHCDEERTNELLERVKWAQFPRMK